VRETRVPIGGRFDFEFTVDLQILSSGRLHEFVGGCLEIVDALAGLAARAG
jgi:hypothetical protein